MDYRAFEQRLLDTIFTTDVPINPATIAFLYKVTVVQASDLLQQAAVNGLLNIESDEEGNILYVFPNRQKLGGKEANKREGALSRPVPGGGPPVLAAPPQVIDMLEAATGPALPPTEPLLQKALPGVARAEAASPDGTARCPFCAETVLASAKKCKHCHEYLDLGWRELQNQKAQIQQLRTHINPSPTPPPASSPTSLQLVQQREQQEAQLQAWHNATPTQAGMLSFFVPGLGQMLSGRVPAGLLWMMFTCLGYCLIVPGIVLHVLCILNAVRMRQQQQQQQQQMA